MNILQAIRDRRAVRDYKPEPGLYVGLPWGIDRVDRVPIDLVRREFDLNVVADRYAELYRQLLSPGSPGDERATRQNCSEIQ